MRIAGEQLGYRSGIAGPMMYVLEALLTAVPSMNSPEAARKSTIDQTNLAVANTPAYALIITKDNSRTAQLNAGMLYSRFQLAALTLGFAMRVAQPAPHGFR